MIVTRLLRRQNWPALFVLGALVLLAIAVGVARGTDSRPAVVYPAGRPALAPLALKAFARPISPRDAAAAHDQRVTEAVDVVTADDANVPEEFLPGHARAGGLRAALTHLGPSDRTIFLVRTTKGRICAGLTGFSSGCLEGLPADVPLTAIAADPDRSGTGEAPLVWGIARNDVKSVDVIVDGSPYPAVMGDNAYFFQLGDAGASAGSIQTVVAHLAGGRSVSVSVVTGPDPSKRFPIIKGGPEASSGP